MTTAKMAMVSALGLLVWSAALGGCAAEGAPDPGDTLTAPDEGPAAIDEGDPPDTAVIVREPLVFPEGLTGGFVDVTATLASPPFPIDVGDAAVSREPEVTFGVFADLNGGKSLEVIVSGAVREEAGHQIYSYDRDSGTLTPWETDPLPPGAVSIAEDLDGDGHVDLVMTHGQGMSVRWGDAQGQFAEATALAESLDIGYDDRTTYQLVDLDGDGWLDLLMNSPCDLLALMRTGLRTWEARAEALQGFQ